MSNKPKATLLPPVTRRKFLGLLGAAGAALGIGPRIPPATAAAAPIVPVAAPAVAATASGAALRYASLSAIGAIWRGSYHEEPVQRPQRALELELRIEKFEEAPKAGDIITVNDMLRWKQPKDSVLQEIEDSAKFLVQTVTVQSAPIVGMTASISAIEILDDSASSQD